MTIGPAPMIRIEEMSVRLGMSLGDIWARGTKKGRALCASFGRRRGCVPARGRSLDQNQRAGRGGQKIGGKGGGRGRLWLAPGGMRVVRAGLWRIWGGAGRAKNPPAASLAIIAASL